MLITFEGIDYSGKTTQAKLLYKELKRRKLKTIFIREPGGTVISEKIREILLDKSHNEMIPLTEFLLFSASRAQLVSEVIRPHLKRNYFVICDRYFDSSTAYQGYGGGLEKNTVEKINRFATSDVLPDITFLLDIDPVTAFERVSVRNSLKDRMENKNLRFYNRVYRGFKTLAKNNKQRFIVIDAKQPSDKIHKQIMFDLNKKIKI